MPRNLFEREMQQLRAGIVDMGHDVDLVLGDTLDVLKTTDPESAAQVGELEGTVDRYERRLEDMCVNIIALQQPLASDLRTITAALKIVTDMERISDQCYDICELIRTLTSGGHPIQTPPRIIEMMRHARGMFNLALEAFVCGDAEKAERVCGSDDTVDKLFSQAVLEGCSNLSGRLVEIPREVDYLFIAKYIERIADHATNIAEWVLFIKTGRHPDSGVKGK